MASLFKPLSTIKSQYIRDIFRRTLLFSLKWLLMFNKKKEKSSNIQEIHMLVSWIYKLKI